MLIELRIGTFQTTLHIFETTAPDSYDAFAAITLYRARISDREEVRLVAICQNDVSWQIARYGSGMHQVTPFGDTSEHFYSITEAAIVNLLLGRLASGDE